MLNPALLGSEESVTMQSMTPPSVVTSTSHVVRRQSTAFATVSPSTCRPVPVLYAPTPRSSGASAFESLFASTPMAAAANNTSSTLHPQLTPLQAEVRRIRVTQYSAAVAHTGEPDEHSNLSPVGHPGATNAVSPMHLGALTPEAVRCGVIPNGATAAGSRPVTPMLETMTLPAMHSHAAAYQQGGCISPATSLATTPLPNWAAPSVRTDAANSFRRDEHGGGLRARENVVQQHRKAVAAIISPVANRVPSWHTLAPAAAKLRQHNHKDHHASDDSASAALKVSKPDTADSQPNELAADAIAVAAAPDEGGVAGVDWVTDSSDEM